MSAGGRFFVVRDLAVRFDSELGAVDAVRGASFELARGEIVALVGESGSGKSVLAQALLGLVPAPGRIHAGSIRCAGREWVGLPERELRALRGRVIALVFQDPSLALDPLMRVERQITEVLLAHGLADGADARTRALSIAARVGLEPAEQALASFPHELSGGMRQRAALAQALVGEPEILVADEATTALDAPLAAEMQRLVRELARTRALATLWITHDLESTRRLAHRVLVMYAGRIVESAPAKELFERPLHPYTRALLRSSVRHSAPRSRIESIRGQPPSAGSRIAGCAFAPRCPLAVAECELAPPRDEPVGAERSVACPRWAEESP